MTRDELETLQESAAHSALSARSRIEAAVDAGELPVWVLETCELWERATLLYGATRARLSGALAVVVPAPPRGRH